MLVCNDARMQEVYWGCFERGPQGLAVLVGAEHVGAPGTVELCQHWRLGASATSEESPEPKTGVPPRPGAPLPTEPREGAQTTRRTTLVGARAALIGAVGRGFRAYPELRSKLLSTAASAHAPDVRLISDELLPRAREVAILAAAEVAAGRTVPAEDAIPVYLRDDVARPAPSRN
jgi:tRNA A37 threonylcarbamoyladenosine modification protein TsaB